MATFELVVTLKGFDVDPPRPLVGKEVNVRPKVTPWPDPVADAMRVNVAGGVTNEEGEARFTLAILPGVAYVVASRGVLPGKVVSAEQEDGAVVRLEDLVSAVPSPIGPVDAAALRAEFQDLIDGIGGGSYDDTDIREQLEGKVDQTELSATIAALLGDVADPENVAELLAAAAVAAAIYGYEDHGSVSGPVDIDPAAGTHVLDATGPTVLTLGGAANGTIISVEASSGADDVAVDGFTGVELTDGSPIVFRRIRDEWKLSVAGGSAGTPDTTPPSAVTDLAATGGEGQVAGAWSASTDTESAVFYRWRVWLTSGGPTGAWTATAGLSFLKTGLPAGAYTAEVYAYSAGGDTTPDSDLATVTPLPGWSTIASDAFTHADGTVITTTTADGFAWTAGLGTTANLTAQSGKAAFTGHADQHYAGLEVNATGSPVRVSGDYDVTAVVNGGLGAGLFLTSTVNGTLYNDALEAIINGDGDVVLRTYQGVVATAAGQPKSGTMRFEMDGDEGTVYINDDLVLTATMPRTVDGRAVGVHFTGYASFAATVDNFLAEEFFA